MWQAEWRPGQYGAPALFVFWQGRRGVEEAFKHLQPLSKKHSMIVFKHKIDQDRIHTQRSFKQQWFHGISASSLRAKTEPIRSPTRFANTLMMYM